MHRHVILSEVKEATAAMPPVRAPVGLEGGIGGSIAQPPRCSPLLALTLQHPPLSLALPLPAGGPWVLHIGPCAKLPATLLGSPILHGGSSQHCSLTAAPLVVSGQDGQGAKDITTGRHQGGGGRGGEWQEAPIVPASQSQKGCLRPAALCQVCLADFSEAALFLTEV